MLYVGERIDSEEYINEKNVFEYVVLFVIISNSV